MGPGPVLQGLRNHGGRQEGIWSSSNIMGKVLRLFLLSHACQILTEPLFHAGHCARYCIYKDEHNGSGSCPHGVLSLSGATDIQQIELFELG